MDQIYQIIAFFVTGGLGLVLFNLIKPNKSSKQNQDVVKTVEEKQKENAELAQKISDSLKDVNKQINDLEKDKQRDLTPEELADWFNKRK